MKLVIKDETGEHEYQFHPLDEYGYRAINKERPKASEIGKLGTSAEFDLCPPIKNARKSWSVGGSGKFWVEDDSGDHVTSGTYSESSCLFGVMTLHNVKMEGENNE